MNTQGKLASAHRKRMLTDTMSELPLAPTGEERGKDEFMMWLIIFLSAVVAVGALAKGLL